MSPRFVWRPILCDYCHSPNCSYTYWDESCGSYVIQSLDTIEETELPQISKELQDEIQMLGEIISEVFNVLTDEQVYQLNCLFCEKYPEKFAPLRMQSMDSAGVTSTENTVLGGSSEAEEQQQETTKFLDEVQGNVNDFASRIAPATLADKNRANMELAEFLSRPVKIATFTWNESDTVNTVHTYSPWNLFFNEARIKYKMNNYSFINCKLKIKVLINASPFYYGAMMMNYQPLPALTPSTIAASASNSDLILQSQRPHCWIYPASNAGCEMTLPFFYNTNFLKIQSAAAFTNMGTLNFINYTTLQSANGVTGDGVTVQVYAWAEDVSVSGPSVGLALQAKDEYKISTTASALAALAGSLVKMPLIGSLATVTQMGAKAIAAGAAAIGYTNAPVIEDCCPYRPQPFPDLASAEISYPVSKVTLDPKNELSIDPRLHGLSGIDEMSISYLAQRESYVATIPWSTSQGPDTLLCGIKVSPNIFSYDVQLSTPNTYVIYMTPLSWLSRLFFAWRGDIIYRFRFIASPFHKGRLVIAYDPQGYGTSGTGENIWVDPDISAAVFTTIVDLGKDSDVELRVPYMQALPWLICDNVVVNGVAPAINVNPSGAPEWKQDDTRQNGFITVRVLTALTAPLATSNVPVLVSVRGADNFEFNNPSNIQDHTNYYSMYALQSLDVYESLPSQQVVVGDVISPDNESRFLLNYGEAITSLRSLLRRTMLSRVWSFAADTTHTLSLTHIVLSKLPISPGFSTNGLDNANAILGSGSKPYNWTKMTHINWVMPAFVAYRGSVNWSVNPETTSGLSSLKFLRMPEYVGTGTQTFNATYGNTSVNAAFYAQSYAGSAGTALTNTYTNAGLNYQHPMMTPYKFCSTAPDAATNPVNYPDGEVNDLGIIEFATNNTVNPTVSNTRLWMYCGIGTDFTLMFFLNVPTIYAYGVIPTAV